MEPVLRNPDGEHRSGRSAECVGGSVPAQLVLGMDDALDDEEGIQAAVHDDVADRADAVAEKLHKKQGSGALELSLWRWRGLVHFSSSTRRAEARSGASSA